MENNPQQRVGYTVIDEILTQKSGKLHYINNYTNLNPYSKTLNERQTRETKSKETEGKRRKKSQYSYK